MTDLMEKRGKSKSKKDSQSKKRIQSGCFHVYLRGNGKKTVFYDEAERAEFLKRCYSTSLKYGSRILAFVIMDNHVHLLLITEHLTKFMNSLLVGFVHWYNKKNGISDKLFKTPFGSANKYSDKDIAESIMYILSNPIRANICKDPREYKWSSFHSYFNKSNALQKNIEIDTAFIESIFESKEDFERSLNGYNADIDKIRKKGKDFWPKESYINIMEYLNLILCGKNIFELTKTERNSLIIKIRKETGASCWHIASLMHESYEEVKRILIC
ncbi:MAG: hypothetical protein CVU13_12200 [Bacteroidetes bacterium HGW-Bacteroidetes-8]|jgi:REP element-mobilizing transposase RayT|nr:MAG: hypothetical protein CVU13_12200 [Bacteroidetes bacterium HGW-Bacteroidetes-8]